MPATIVKKKTTTRKKTIDYTQEMPKERKVVKVLEEYQELATWKLIPLHESVIERIATELVEWAKNDKSALKMSAFFVNKNIPIQYLYRWKEKYPVMNSAYETAMLCIGNRREEGAIKREYDAGMIRAMQPMYDKDWKEMEIWRATLNEKQEKQNDIRVIIERFPSVESVPDKRVAIIEESKAEDL